MDLIKLEQGTVHWQAVLNTVLSMIWKGEVLVRLRNHLICACMCLFAHMCRDGRETSKICRHIERDEQA